MVLCINGAITADTNGVLGVEITLVPGWYSVTYSEKVNKLNLSTFPRLFLWCYCLYYVSLKSEHLIPGFQLFVNIVHFFA